MKGKVRPLVESIYGFESSTRESIKSGNRRLTRQLKDKFGLCYRVSGQYPGLCSDGVLIICSKNLGDKKNNIPRSGLFRTKLNQKAANLIWYRNKKDEGIVFEKYFTPFPIPAMALLYTAVSHAIELSPSHDDKRHHRQSVVLMNGPTGNEFTSISQVASTRRFMIGTLQILRSSIHEPRTMESSTRLLRRSTTMEGKSLSNIYISSLTAALQDACQSGSNQ